MYPILSAVNTLLVCHLDAPSELENNHPEEIAVISKAWLVAYPLGMDTNVSKFSVVV